MEARSAAGTVAGPDRVPYSGLGVWAPGPMMASGSPAVFTTVNRSHSRH
ncbi:hypothetical protein OHT57_02530 [Streptomyces sp. NBC_00285]|nr:hypothetical protein [Streptomyces sp. NBC_00285]